MATMNVSLPDAMKDWVEGQTQTGRYSNASDYVRDLIRRDMERRDGQFVQEAILAGYRDLAAGRVFASSGDFKTDMAMLDSKEANGWQ